MQTLPKTSDSSEATTPDHGITIESLPADMFRALCLCGYVSPEPLATRAAARKDGRSHIAATKASQGTGHNASADAPTGMVYPIMGPDGVMIEQFVADRSVDPFVDNCPTWCLYPGEHPSVFNDVDRKHFGEVIAVPIRSIPFDREEDGYVMGTVQMWLQQHVLLAEPTIRLGEGDSGKADFDLSLDEAEAIGRTLLRFVEAAR